MKNSRSHKALIEMSSQYPEDEEDEEPVQNFQAGSCVAASKEDLKDERLVARTLPGAEALPLESANGDVQCSASVGPSSISSLPYGGARPKTRLIPLDIRSRRGDDEVKRGADEAQRSAELRSRLSECEVNVQPCDTFDEKEEGTEGAGTSRAKERSGTFGRVESRIDTRGDLRGVNNRNDRVGWNSLPEDTEVGEDEFCIYTYKGGTAYLTADLPNSFFR